MDNNFCSQFDSNIKFSYSCFDRIILRGYIRKLFPAAGVVLLLRSLGFKRFSNGVMRILTDQFNAHIKKVAEEKNIPILWWRSVCNGKNGDKLRYVMENYAKTYHGPENHVYCIIATMEKTTTFSSKAILTKKGKEHFNIYRCNKLVKHYYIYFHDEVLGGPCYLKLSSYLPFHAEFYINGHNIIKQQLDQRGIPYTMKDNVFTSISDLSTLQDISKEIDGTMIESQIAYWMEIFFRFFKGKYSTRSRRLQHDWFSSQVEVCSNVIFKSSQFCNSLFERLLDNFSKQWIAR